MPNPMVRMNDWKRLNFDDDGKMKTDKSNISILTEWEVIQERFLKADDATKLHIKEQLRKIAFPETTDLKPPCQPVKTKGAPKKVKPTSGDSSTTRSPSYFEHIDKVFPDSPTPKSQKSDFKGACISKLPPTPIPPKIPFIDHMSVFMHKYIKRIVNVEGDSNCDFRVVSDLLDREDEYYHIVRDTLIRELTGNKELYTCVLGSKEKVEEKYHALVPPKVGFAPEDKWMRFSEMGHLIASAYERVCINLTRYGFSKTYFPLHTAPTPNPNDRIICVGWISNLQHFVQVYLKSGCHIPPTSLKWALHFTNPSETWPDQFIERMKEYNKLNQIEIEKK